MLQPPSPSLSFTLRDLLSVHFLIPPHHFRLVRARILSPYDWWWRCSEAGPFGVLRKISPYCSQAHNSGYEGRGMSFVAKQRNSDSLIVRSNTDEYVEALSSILGVHRTGRQEKLQHLATSRSARNGRREDQLLQICSAGHRQAPVNITLRRSLGAYLLTSPLLGSGYFLRPLKRNAKEPPVSII